MKAKTTDFIEELKREPREDRKDCKVPQIQRQSHPSAAMKGRPNPRGA